MRAAVEGAEVLIVVGEKRAVTLSAICPVPRMQAMRDILLVRVRPVSQLVHRQRHRTAIIQKVLYHAVRSSKVGRSIAANEVRQHIDIVAHEFAWSGDAGDGDTSVGLCVVAKDEGVRDEQHELLLTGWGVRFAGDEGSVVVADGDVLRSFGGDGVEESEGEGQRSFEGHGERRRIDWSMNDMLKKRTVAAACE